MIRFSWSFPIGRLFGITCGSTVFFPLVAVGLVLRAGIRKDGAARAPGSTPASSWACSSSSVLLHEFGHCFAARWVDGDAKEVLLWPLGGLADVEVPHTPRAHFLTAAGGPAVNLLLCLRRRPGCWPSRFDRPCSRRGTRSGCRPARHCRRHRSTPDAPGTASRRPLDRSWPVAAGPALLGQLVPVPAQRRADRLPAGRRPHAPGVLWPSLGYRQATLTAVFAGFVVDVRRRPVRHRRQRGAGRCAWRCSSTSPASSSGSLLETGGEESLFGYDFSQGYTSLERDQPPGRRREAAAELGGSAGCSSAPRSKLQREQEQREAEERRMDELLEKVQRAGHGSR